MKLLVLLAVSALPYLGIVHNEFFMDAERAILLDPGIRSVRNIPSHFTRGFFDGASPDGSQIATLGYYRPVVKAWHTIQYWLFGPRPEGYNVSNILLNGVAVLLACLLVERLREGTGFWAAVLWAVNPARTEAVCWVYGDSNILMGVFCLASLLLYVSGSRTLALLPFALALLSRESAVLLPAIIVLLEFLVRGSTPRESLLRAVPFAGVTAAYLAVRHLAVGTIPLTQHSPLALLETISVITARFVKIFFLPDAPVTQYSARHVASFPGGLAASLAVCAALALVAVVLWKREKNLLFFYLWFFVWISVCFNAGRLMDYLMAEKELYLAGLGFAALGAALLKRLPFRVAIAAGTLAAVLHGAVTWHRSQFWRDGKTYLEKAVEFAPDFYLFHYNLGNEYAKRGELRKAMSAYARCIELAPGLSLAHNNLANSCFNAGERQRALRLWHRAIELDPRNPSPYLNLGLALEVLGDFPGARDCYRRARAAGAGDPSVFDQRIARVEARMALPQAGGPK